MELTALSKGLRLSALESLPGKEGELEKNKLNKKKHGLDKRKQKLQCRCDKKPMLVLLTKKK